jgi:hypothetical protein
LNEEKRCSCAACTAWRQRDAIEASEKRAKAMLTFDTVEALKRAVGVQEAERMFDMPKIYRDATIYGRGMEKAADAFYPRFTVGWNRFDGYTSNIDTTKQPKHKRKATKLVTKQAMNEPARNHAEEAADMVEEARDLLRAADAFDGMRVFDVVVPEEKQWNGKHAITIILEKITPEEDDALAAEFEDKTLMYAYKNGMVAVANRIRSVLQQSGRKLLLDATLSMHKLVAPEMAAAVAIENAAKQEANVASVGNPPGTLTPPKAKKAA